MSHKNQVQLYKHKFNMMHSHYDEDIDEEFTINDDDDDISDNNLVFKKQEKEILSEAYLKSQILIGNADARAIEIYANAYDGYKEFYNFKRTLDSYKSSIDSTTKIILSTDNKYLKYLNQK